MTASSQPPHSHFPRHIRALAAALGVSRPTVYAWLERSDSPGREPCGCFDVARWSGFADRVRRRRKDGTPCRNHRPPPSVVTFCQHTGAAAASVDTLPAV